jgi:hypothetical protein
VEKKKKGRRRRAGENQEAAAADSGLEDFSGLSLRANLERFLT